MVLKLHMASTLGSRYRVTYSQCHIRCIYLCANFFGMDALMVASPLVQELLLSLSLAETLFPRLRSLLFCHCFLSRHGGGRGCTQEFPATKSKKTHKSSTYTIIKKAESTNEPEPPPPPKLPISDLNASSGN